MEFPGVLSTFQSVSQYCLRLARTIDGVQKDLAGIGKAGYITRAQVTQAVDSTSIAKNLQAGGLSPLNVSNLIGHLAQPQLAGVPQVAALPAANSPLAQEGALVRFNGLLYFFDQSRDPGVWKPVGAVGAIILGTHAQRVSGTYTPPSAYPDGAIFYETDRKLLYVVNTGFWDYLSGVYIIAYASIAALEATLTNHDTGLRVHINNFDHTIKWGGTTAKWGWDVGDMQGGYRQDCAVAPDNVETGWQICDGTATTYLKITAGVLSTPAFTTPNITGNPSYNKLGAAYTGTINVPTAPTLSGSTATGTAVIAPVLSGAGFAQITGATGVDIVVAGNPVPVISAGAVNVSASPHTHTITPATAPDTGHQHVVSPVDSGHTHGIGTLVAGTTGEPQNIVFVPWFRR